MFPGGGGTTGNALSALRSLLISASPPPRHHHLHLRPSWLGAAAERVPLGQGRRFSFFFKCVRYRTREVAIHRTSTSTTYEYEFDLGGGALFRALQYDYEYGKVRYSTSTVCECYRVLVPYLVLPGGQGARAPGQGDHSWSLKRPRSRRQRS